MTLSATTLEATAIDAQAFETLMRRTHRQAFALAYRLTGNAAEAEDLIQDTYLRAYRFFHRYDRSLSFTAWLYRIMSNTHIDMVRRRGRFRTTSLDQNGADGTGSWDMADERSTAEQAMQDGAIEEPMQRALIAMNPEFRTAVLLADVEGLAYEEIADAMNTSVGTVRSRIHRGRKQLRSHLLDHASEAYGRYVDDLQ